MLPTSLLLRLALTLTLLALLLAGCAHESPLSKPVPAPAIPPLPAQARQTDLPTFSRNAQIDMQAWLLPPTAPSSPGMRVKPPTDH